MSRSVEAYGIALDGGIDLLSIRQLVTSHDYIFLKFITYFYI
ncbi:MAG: hypothetical protein Faunusvirus16_7 [Faunusvirus sp.]|uniref:Uncharacterized protein n=1 Tax=Faunusvirus sp. TaxID=2487766 RepID=A0A3G5A0U7_9VIRU|nr:MAG: hypothetical protein Faunusvirus16_7 [Faunusvirus sp.]